MDAWLKRLIIVLVVGITPFKTTANEHVKFKVTLQNHPLLVKLSFVPWSQEPQWNLYTSNDQLMNQLVNVVFNQQNNTLSADFVDFPHLQNVTFQVQEHQISNKFAMLYYTISGASF